MAQEFDSAFKPKQPEPLDSAFKPVQRELDSAFKPVIRDPDTGETNVIPPELMEEPETPSIWERLTTPLDTREGAQIAAESPELPGPTLSERFGAEVSQPINLIGELIGPVAAAGSALYGGLKGIKYLRRMRGLSGAADDVVSDAPRLTPDEAPYTPLELDSSPEPPIRTGTFDAGLADGPLPSAYRDRSGRDAMEALVPDRYKVSLNEADDIPTPEVINAIKTNPDTQAMFAASNERVLNALKEGKPLMHAVEPQDLVNLADQIKLNPRFLPEEMKSARNGITALMKGEVPTPTQIGQLIDTFGDDFADTLIEMAAKSKTNIGRAQDLSRAILTSFDFSAPGRQGKKFWFTPEYWKSFPAMFRSWGSEKLYKATLDAIKEHPNFIRPVDESGKVIGKSKAERAGIDITDLLTNREEIFRSKMAERIPGVRMSERAYVAFLNKLRSDRFNKLIDLADKAGIDTNDDKFLKGLGDFINNATGRGSLDVNTPWGKFQGDRQAGWLNNIFFAPKLHAGKLRLWGQGIRGMADPVLRNVLSPDKYEAMDPFVRKEVLKTLFADASLALAGTKLAEEMGARVEWDPTSSDFMKFRLGNTRVDPHAGDQQYLVAATRMVHSLEKSLTGKDREFGDKSAGEVALNFGANKLAPIPSFIVNVMFDRDYDEGNIVMNQAIDKIAPIMTQDLMEIYEDNPDNLWLIGPALFGVGVQTYGR